MIWNGNRAIIVLFMKEKLNIAVPVLIFTEPLPLAGVFELVKTEDKKLKLTN